MAGAFVGVSTVATSTTSPVTGSWTVSAGSLPLTAGDTLVAVVTSEATTSSTLPACSTAGWVQIGPGVRSNSRCCVTMWAKVAAGSDAAPAFTSTMSGSYTALHCTLYELSGLVPLAMAAGVATGTTTNPLAPATAFNVPLADGVAIGGQALYTGSNAADAWTKPTAWTAGPNTGGSTARYHTASDYLVGPAADAALTYGTGASWNAAGTYCAAQVVVLAPAGYPYVVQDAASAVVAAGTGTAVATPPNNLSAGTKLVAICGVNKGFADSLVPTGVADASANAFTSVAATPAASGGGGNYNPSVSVWVLDTPAGDVGAKPAITASLPTGHDGGWIILLEVANLFAGTTASLDGSPGLAGSVQGAASMAQPALTSAVAGEWLLSVGAQSGWNAALASAGYTLSPRSLQPLTTMQGQVAYTLTHGAAEAGTWTGGITTGNTAMAVLAVKYTGQATTFTKTGGAAAGAGGSGPEVVSSPLVKTGAGGPGAGGTGTKVYVAAPPKVTVTFMHDDGRASQYNLRSVYSSHGMHATFYVNSAYVGMDAGTAPDGVARMPWSELLALASDGHDVGNHTAHHYAWSGDSATWSAELAQCTADIIAQGLRAPDSMSYPIGYYNTTAGNLAAAAGLLMGHLGDPDAYHYESMPPANGWLYSRFAVNGMPTQATITTDVTACQGAAGRWWLLYISHEGAAPNDTDLDNCLTWCAANGIPVKSVHEVLWAEQASKVTSGRAGAGAGGSGAKTVTAGATTYTKTGGAAAGAGGTGPKTVTPATTYTKTGGAAAGAAGSGPKTITTAATVTKTGAAATAGTGSGPKTVTPAAVYAKTTGTAAGAAGSGPKTITAATTYAKTAAAAAGGAGAGPKLVQAAGTVAKTGAGAAAGTGGGPETVTGAAGASKTASGAAGTAGTGEKTVTQATTYTKTGGAAAAGAGTAAQSVQAAGQQGKTGGGATAGAGAGPETVTHAAVTAKTGGAGGAGAGTGGKVRDRQKTGGAGLGAAGSGPKQVTQATTYTKTVSVAAGAGGSGAKLLAHVYTKTGAAAAGAMGGGPELITHTIYKLGGAAAAGAGDGSSAVAAAIIVAKTGAGAGGVAGDGHKVIVYPAVFGTAVQDGQLVTTSIISGTIRTLATTGGKP